MGTITPLAHIDLPTGARSISDENGAGVTVRWSPVAPSLFTDGAFVTGVGEWTAQSQATIAHETSIGKILNTKSLKVTRDSTGSTGVVTNGIAYSSAFTVHPGVMYRVSAWIRGDGYGLVLAFYDDAGAYITPGPVGSATQAPQTDTTAKDTEFCYARSRLGYAPANAATARLWVTESNNTATLVGYFDGIDVMPCVPIVEDPAAPPTTWGSQGSADLSYVPSIKGHHDGDIKLFDMGASTDIEAAESAWTRVRGLRHKWTTGRALIQGPTYRIMFQEGGLTTTENARYKWAIWTEGAGWTEGGYGELGTGGIEASKDYYIERVLLLENSGGLVRLETRDTIGNRATFNFRRGIPWVGVATERAYAETDANGAAVPERYFDFYYNGDGPEFGVYRGDEVLRTYAAESSITAVDPISVHGNNLFAMGPSEGHVTGLAWAMRCNQIQDANDNPTDRMLSWQETSQTFRDGLGAVAEEEGTTRRYFLMFLPWPWMRNRNFVFANDDADSLNVGGLQTFDGNSIEPSGYTYVIGDAADKVGFEARNYRDVPPGVYTLHCRAKYKSGETSGKLVLSHEEQTGASTYTEDETQTFNLGAAYDWYDMQVTLNDAAFAGHRFFAETGAVAAASLEHDDDDGNHGSAIGGTGDVAAYAQSFVGQATDLTAVDLKVWFTGTPAGSMYVQIYENCYNAQDEASSTSFYVSGSASWGTTSNITDTSESSYATFGTGVGTSYGYVEWDFGSAVQVVGVVWKSETNGHTDHDVALQSSTNGNGSGGGTWTTRATVSAWGANSPKTMSLWSGTAATTRYWRARIKVEESGESWVYQAWPLIKGNRTDVYHAPATVRGEGAGEDDLNVAWGSVSRTGNWSGGAGWMTTTEPFTTPGLVEGTRYWLEWETETGGSGEFFPVKSLGGAAHGTMKYTTHWKESWWQTTTSDLNYKLHFTPTVPADIHIDALMLLPHERIDGETPDEVWFMGNAQYDCLLDVEARNTVRRVR